jgi:DNA repair protein RadC
MAQSARGIKAWPEGERPREKLLSRGPEALTEAELLAVLLRTGDGHSGVSALDVARDLWGHYGGRWEELVRATPAELAARPGLGPAKAATVLAALEVGRRAASRALRNGTPFRESRQVQEHFAARFSDLKREEFWCLLLDTKNRCLREVRISEGTLTASLVHPREAFHAAVRDSASAVLFAHNHPSGDTLPSREDAELTRRLCEAGKILGIRVLDHVIVAGGRHYSFADEGELPAL